MIGEKSFFSSYGGTVIMVTKAGHNSSQNNYHIITFFFLRKSNFYGHFQRKNSFHFYIISFKRSYVNCSLAIFKGVATFHEMLYNEQRRIFYFYVAFYYGFLITHL